MRDMVNAGYLDMERLAELDTLELENALNIQLMTMVGGSLNKEIEYLMRKGYEGAGADAMERCTLILKRLREGVKVLKNNSNALEAFRLQTELWLLNVFVAFTHC